MRLLLSLVPVALVAAMSASAQPVPVSAMAAGPAQVRLIDRAQRAGARDVTAAAQADGGTILNGTLQGRRFVLAIPANWTGETILFGQGYGTPGSTPTVPADPIAKDPGGGTFSHAYKQGVASGIAAFDKSGVATESGARNAILLRGLAAKLGATRFYALGGSMGGSIVMSIIERYPRAVSGAVSMCGITEGWIAQVRQLMDLRGAYNVLTEGTPYALPGERSLTRSALPVVPPRGVALSGDTFREQQKFRLLGPVLMLFQAAKAKPDGPEARIIRQLAAVSGFAPDPAAIGVPLFSAALGMDDIVATMGGIPVGNRDRSYSPPEMTTEQVADFNRWMQRYDADPKAVAYARDWHEATGRFVVPLVTVHQTIDALVPFAQSEGLARAVARAGNGARLAQYAVPPTRFTLPGGLEGYTHCGFSPAQNIAAFEAMRTWVKTGRRPGPEAVK